MRFSGVHVLLQVLFDSQYCRDKCWERRLRYYDLEGGTRGAAVNGFADLDELSFFGYTAHSCYSHRLHDARSFRVLLGAGLSPGPPLNR